jgi:hypothetical protein
MLEYPHELKTYRYLFSDGRTEDVRANHDDSVVRKWVLDQMDGGKDFRIEGVALIDNKEET